jgi:acyl carrier protein
MTTADLERLTKVFRAIFNRPTFELHDEMTAKDVPGWDSLNHVNLIIQIEQEFKIRFANTEVSALANVAQMKALIAAKLGRA